MTADLSVVILTYNEEKNIGQALASVCGWAKQVFVFDSFSPDRTVEIARSFPGCVVVQHRFVDYGSQRNAALRTLPIETEWVFFLDADEYPSVELRDEIAEVIASNPKENGFHVRFRLIWMGRWIRRGYYGAWLLRLFRHASAVCEARAVNEHVDVEGATGYLEHDIIHEDRNGLDRWLRKHIAYAEGEAQALTQSGGGSGELAASLFGRQVQRKRWVRYRVWSRLPPLVRPFLYFTYRYALRGGFLEGRPALAYHLLQGLWFNMVVDLKYLELSEKKEEARRARVIATNHEERVRSLFDEKAKYWSAKYRDEAGVRWRIGAFVEAVAAHVAPPAEVLDFGCGTGEIAAQMAARGYRVTGCDISDTMIANAQRAFGGQGRWLVLDPTSRSLPFDDAQFAALVASSVLEYVADAEATFREWRRIVRPGGTVVITVPDMAHRTRLLEMVGGALAKSAAGVLLSRLPGRVSSYAKYLQLSKNRASCEEWAALAGRHGFVKTGARISHGALVMLVFERRQAEPGKTGLRAQA